VIGAPKGPLFMRHAISLFSSAGIGELGLVNNGVSVLAACELHGARCGLYRQNFPDTKMFEGDINTFKADIVSFTRGCLGKEQLFLLYATPPCQGMSTNGVGKLNAEVRAGNRAEGDKRNLLILPALEIVEQLQPMWVLFENVPGMRRTSIPVDGEMRPILEIVHSRLVKLGYEGGAEVVECSDYGVPQTRKRLITVYAKHIRAHESFLENGMTFLPRKRAVPAKTLREAIGHLPPLDASEGKNASPDYHPLHRVNVLSKEKYWWVSNTPEGDTAYNNQCVNPLCLFRENPLHVDQKVEGRWRSNGGTPIYCLKCGELLPRPSMVDESGKRRLIKGFHSAYRRMRHDEPARALTRNFPFEASDNKIHPTQNRVLSVYEAMIVQSIADYGYEWISDGKPAGSKLIADSIGESVPPLLIDQIVKNMICFSSEWQSDS
jgi:DNA (cytosine-5)-methyltransferase 1